VSRQDAKSVIQNLLCAGGISTNGDNPWDLQVHNEDFYELVLTGGALALGESYMAGWWDCRALDAFFDKILRARLDNKMKKSARFYWQILAAKVFNLQKKSRAFLVGKKHYDIGNDLYRAMLDSNMVYTCGYWKRADNLDDAQIDKMDLVCRKVGLQPGMKVLELGCGWGSFARYAAQKYGAEVTAVTVSKEQVSLGKELCQGLPVNIRLQDYRKVEGLYDRVISIGIMEHVGYKNYRTYMETVARTLKDDGIAFFHTIGNNFSMSISNPWTTRYIFPNGQLPSISQLAKAMEGLFVMEDWHNFGPDYDKTLMAWHDNFEKNWPEFAGRYGDRFYRMWRYYLLSSAGAFRSRSTQLWQVVMTKPGRAQPECRLI